MNTIIDIYYAHKQRYGYRRITLELNNRGYVVNHKKVKRLMCIMDLYAITPKAKYKSYKGDMNGITKNLLLTKIVDEENMKLIMRETSIQQAAMRYGLQMYLNFV